MIEAYFNVVSYNFSGRDLAKYQNQLDIVSSFRNPIWAQEIRNLFIRR